MLPSLPSPPYARSTLASTSLTKREAKLAAATERHRAELQAMEADLAAVHTELVSATAARSAAAARVAIPCASDKADIETFAHSTIQTLSGVGESAGPCPNANLLHEHLHRSAEIIRLVADEAAVASAAAPAAHGTSSPEDSHIDYADDMDQDDANEEDIRPAQAVLQSELDTLDLGPECPRAASLRASIRALAPEKLGESSVTKQHLKDKGRAAPATAPPSS